MAYSAGKVDQKADELAAAVQRMRPFMYEKDMEGESEYEQATIDLWRKLNAYKRARAQR